MRTDFRASESIPKSSRMVGATCEVANGVFTSRAWISGFETIKPTLVSPEAEPAVLSVLFRRGGVDGAVYRLHDDIGRAAVGRRVVELQLEFGSGKHLIDEQSPGIGVQVGRGRWRLALVLQPD